MSVALRASGAYATSTATSLSPVIPAGAQAGDLLVLFLRGQSTAYTSDAALPSGWTRVGGSFTAKDTTTRITGMWIKVASSSDAGTSVAITLSASARSVAFIAAYSGVDSNNPVVTSSGYTTMSTGATSLSIPAFAGGDGLFVVEQWASEFSANQSYALTSYTGGLGTAVEAFNPSGSETVSASRTAMRIWSGTAPSGGVPAHVISTTGNQSSPTVQMIVLKAGTVVAPPRTPYNHEVQAFVPTADGSGVVKAKALYHDGKSLAEVAPLVAIPRNAYTSVANMESRSPFWIAHRGGSRDYPEMSSYAYLESGCLGFGAYELSLAKTSDGVLFGMHDASLDRTSYGTGGGSGTQYLASSLTWAQVQASPGILGSSAANNTGQRAQPYQTFADFVKNYTDRVVFVDLKVISDVATVDAVLDIMDAHGGPARWVAKCYGVGNNTFVTRAMARGYKSWGYFYTTDASNFATWAPKYDYVGMEYGATSDTVDSLMAAAKSGAKLVGHILPDVASWTSTQSWSRKPDGFMVAGVKSLASKAVA